MVKKTQQVYELIAYSIIMIYCSVMLGYAYLNPVKSKVTGMPSYTFPVTSYIIMFVISAVLFIFGVFKIIKIVNEYKRIETELTESQKEKYVFQFPDKRILYTLGMIILYAIGWNSIGFTISTILLVTCESKILKKDFSWKASIFVAILAVIIVNTIFVVMFKIDLPEPILNMII